jgi:hypothetical protein
MPVPGGTTEKLSKASWAQRRSAYRSWFRSYSFSTFRTERVGGAEEVDLHGVVDDQVGRHHGVDAGRVSAHGLEPVAHGGEIHHGGHAGEVLEHHPARHERDVGARVGRAPGRDGADVVLGHVGAAGVPQHVLEQDPDRERKPVERIDDAFLLQPGQPVERGFAFRQVDGLPGSEWIGKNSLSIRDNRTGREYEIEILEGDVIRAMDLRQIKVERPTSG